MGQLVFQATLGGQVNLVGPNTASTLNINVPAFAGTMASLASVTNNGVAYVNSSGQPTTGSAITFDGTNFATTGTASATKMIPTGGSATGNGMYLPASNTLAWSNNGSETMRLDSSGNLGLGVTPSAWTGFLAFQTSYGSFAGTTSEVDMSHNAYYNAGWKYIANGYATNHYQNNGAYIWRTAPSGTAGNAITFTQAMTLDASGNLGIGTSSNLTKLTVQDTNGIPIRFGDISAAPVSQTAVYIGVSTSALNSNNGDLVLIPRAGFNTIFYTGATTATERMRIDSSGNLLVGKTSGVATVDAKTTTNQQVGRFSLAAASSQGTPAVVIAKQDNTTTTSQIFVQFLINSEGTGSGQINANGASAVAFGSYSDSRLKENIVDLPPQLANIMALRPAEFDYIESEGGGHQIGFIAQEMETVYPDVVGERSDGMKTITGWSKTEARLVKALQELKQIVDAQAATLATQAAEIAALKTKVG